MPLVGLFDLGYLFKSYPQQTRALDAGAASRSRRRCSRARTSASSAGRTISARAACWRAKPVHEPEDLAGLKIRTLPNPVITECLRLMGAAATPLAFGEIYTALQAGVLDGLEHDPPTILASKFYETAKYYALTQHIFSPLVTYFSDADVPAAWSRSCATASSMPRRKAAVATRAHGLAVEEEALDALKETGRRRDRLRPRGVPQARAAADRSVHGEVPGGQADHRDDPRHHGADRQPRRRPAPALRRWITARCWLRSMRWRRCCWRPTCVVVVASRGRTATVLNAPIEWSDDVARGLMVALSFFGAAAALARGDNVGVAFFADRLPAAPRRRRRCGGVDAGGGHRRLRRGRTRCSSAR